MTPCEKCDREHTAGCRGHRSKNHATDPGGPCGKEPMRGQTVCNAHGGMAPQNRAAAQKRIAEERAEKAMRRFGGPIDTTPTEALLDAVRWTAGYVLWLREAVEADDTDESLAAKLAEWIDQLRKLCTDAIRCGIEERRVRFAEQQGQMVADVIKAILGDLDLTPEQQGRVAEVVPLHLRRLMHVA